jgi:hypothetical protein
MSIQLSTQLRWFLLCLLVAGLSLVSVRLRPRTPSLPEVETLDSGAGTPAQEMSDASTLSRSGSASLDASSPTARWLVLLAQPRTPERDLEMLALIEKLAATDPSQALLLAWGETDEALRLKLLQAAVQGWASLDADAAVAWLHNQESLDVGLGMAAVFRGAAGKPEAAAELFQRLSGQYPERAANYGSYAISALAGISEFTRAADIAANGPADVRADWLNLAFARWADSRPQDALARVAELPSPDSQRVAFDAIISRWADNDPKAVADFAVTLPPGDLRTFAASAALSIWSERDIVAAATWLTYFSPSSELDAGTAAIATASGTLKQPHVAIAWAERIVESGLRSNTLAAVVEAWAKFDVKAALDYVQNSPYLQSQERSQILANLGLAANGS